MQITEIFASLMKSR